MSRVNQMLVDDLGDGCFVTLMLVCLDPANRSLVYAGAGHIPGYVLNASGFSEHTLESSGLPSAWFSHVRLSRNRSITLAPGQLLVLLTDDITESTAPKAMNGEPRAPSTTSVLIATSLPSNPSTASTGRLCALPPTSPQKDDITSVIVKVEPPPSASLRP